MTVKDGLLCIVPTPRGAMPISMRAEWVSLDWEVVDANDVNGERK